jgi:hypothetical protein
MGLKAVVGVVVEMVFKEIIEGSLSVQGEGSEKNYIKIQ